MNSESPRGRLLEAAMRLLSNSGPEALQTRRLAAEAGVSTMAVYTHFGGMRELIQELAREGFVRFGRRLAQAPASDDPVADLFLLGLAYRDHALDNPPLYRLMFGVTAPGALRHRGEDLTASALSSELPEGRAAFATLLQAVQRVIASGRVRPADPAAAAAQIWSAIHGYVLLEIAGFFDGTLGVEQVFRPLAVTLAIGLGDTVEAAERSAARLDQVTPEISRAMGRGRASGDDSVVGGEAPLVVKDVEGETRRSMLGHDLAVLPGQYQCGRDSG